MIIFDADDPLVLNGTYDREGYKPGERRRLAARPAPKGFHPMFTPDLPLTLTDVNFTTEVVDEETRRVVVCVFSLAPFTPLAAEALNVKSLLFDSAGQPKAAIDAAILQIDVPLQRVTFAMFPDQAEPRIVFEAVQVDPKLRIKVKRDREPAVCEATLKINFRYPSAEDLLYIANGVNDTHYLTFEPEQGDLLTRANEVAATPARRGRKGRLPVDGSNSVSAGVHAEH